MATECWLNEATVPEPAKHQTPAAAPVDEAGETIPQRLQVLTNDEAYKMFEENYREKVRSAMKGKYDKIRSKYISNNENSKNINERLDRIQERFPGKTWFLRNKPEHTKMNYNHTTGLCKDCYSPKVNYDTVVKHARSQCVCKTAACPNWFCICSEDEDCSCDGVCSCDDCLTCQVTKNST